MQLDEGLDTGPVIAALETPIAEDETGGSLSARLSYLGAMMIDDVVPDLLAGRLEAAPQLRAGVSVAEMLSPAEARLEAAWECREYASAPYEPSTRVPGLGSRWTVHASRCIERRFPMRPSRREWLLRSTVTPSWDSSGGSLRIDIIQPAGRSPMSGTAWLNGRRGIGGRIDSATE